MQQVPSQKQASPQQALQHWWCAARRLRAARLRGDADEVRRMEALFGDLLAEAVGVEGN